MLNPGLYLSDVKIQATFYATTVRNISWDSGAQSTDLKIEAEKKHHLKPQQQRAAGEVASLFPLGHKVFEHRSHAGTLSHIQQRGCTYVG